jgi:preprotein translocase subunit SecA
LDKKKLALLEIKLQNLLGISLAINNVANYKEVIKQHLFFFKSQVQITYGLKEIEMKSIENGSFEKIARALLLYQIDYSWMGHLQKIAFLRESIRWSRYGQKDPLTEYKKGAFNYFLIMLIHIRYCLSIQIFKNR